MIDLNLPYLTEEHRSLAMLMKEFCEREVDLKKLNEIADQPIPPNATSADLRARMPWDLISKAHDAGLRQIAAPAEFGGGGYGEDHIGQGAMARWPAISAASSAGSSPSPGSRCQPLLTPQGHCGGSARRLHERQEDHDGRFHYRAEQRKRLSSCPTMSRGPQGSILPAGRR